MKIQTQVGVLTTAFVIASAVNAITMQHLGDRIDGANKAYAAGLEAVDAKIQSRGELKNFVDLEDRVAHIQDGWRRANNLHKSFLDQRKREWERMDEMRWDIDDLRIATTPETDQDIDPNHPENVVVVSKNYPANRLPYGVKIDDKRPEDRRLNYAYIALPVDKKTERRQYPSVIDYNPQEKQE